VSPAATWTNEAEFWHSYRGQINRVIIGRVFESERV